MEREHTSAATTQPAERKGRSLKSLVVDPFTQIKLGVYVLAFTTIFLVSAGWLFYNSFVEQYTHVMQIFEITDPDTQWETITNDVFYANLYKIGGLFTLYALVLIATIFRITHRYHGPLISMERFAASIASGHYYKRVQVRKKDELKTLAEHLNLMAKTLEAKHGSLINEAGESLRRRTSDTSAADMDKPDATDDAPSEANSTLPPPAAQAQEAA